MQINAERCMRAWPLKNIRAIAWRFNMDIFLLDVLDFSDDHYERGFKYLTDFFLECRSTG